VHKANVLQLSSGLFKRVCLEVAEEYPDVAWTTSTSTP
jgi:3-isopropylmalate dehydrogenase